jgi:uncharacterized membrane protein YedE/YeeE
MALVGAFIGGLVFGFGLLISGMANPAKVLGFLDIFGAWDATLAVVMIAALVVTGAGYVLARRRGRPLFDDTNQWPVANVIDGKLVLGAALFGIGWGLIGLCPGPALVNLATLSPKVLAFVAAMLAGMWLRGLLQRREAARIIARQQAALAADG